MRSMGLKSRNNETGRTHLTNKQLRVLKVTRFGKPTVKELVLILNVCSPWDLPKRNGWRGSEGTSWEEGIRKRLKLWVQGGDPTRLRREKRQEYRGIHVEMKMSIMEYNITERLHYQIECLVLVRFLSLLTFTVKIKSCISFPIVNILRLYTNDSFTHFWSKGVDTWNTLILKGTL